MPLIMISKGSTKILSCLILDQIFPAAGGCFRSSAETTGQKVSPLYIYIEPNGQKPLKICVILVFPVYSGVKKP